MSTKLICVRHGNTFKKGNPITYIGSKTDLPLVETVRAKAVGRYLMVSKQIPSIIFTGPLLRHQQTGKAIKEELNLDLPIETLEAFQEIDYGIDENQLSTIVENRIGKRALEAWHNNAIVPNGWNVDIAAIQMAWQKLSKRIIEKYYQQTSLLVTSNGILRFAYSLLERGEAFKQEQRLHMRTGSLSILQEEEKQWHCSLWDYNPYEQGY